MFELAEPAPVILTGFIGSVVSPVWNTAPTTLPRRDIQVLLEELKVTREQRGRREREVAPGEKGLLERAQGGHRREPELEVVDTDQADSSDETTLTE